MKENAGIRVKEIEKSSIALKAYKAIKELILGKKIKNKINQEEIANLLGISRTPVVIALNQLTTEGYLKQIPYKGFFIKEQSKKEFDDINETRILYEKLGAEKLISNISEEKIGVLNNFIKKFIDCFKKNDMGNYRNLDIKFHNYIIKQTNNQYIIDQYLNGMIIPNINSSFIPMEESIKQHIKIVDYINAKDLEESKKAIEKHIESLLFK